MEYRDVSDRREGGPEDRDFLAAVLGTIATGIIITDEQFVVRWHNRSAGECFPGVTVGRNMYELLAPIAHEQKIDRLLLHQDRIFIPEGDDYPLTEWVRGSRRMPDGEHVILLWPASLTDELIQRRADFTMSAFHELRTPLTTLLGFVELLELDAEDLDSGQREAVTLIGQTARELNRLVQDLLDLAMNSFGELRLDLRETDLSDLVRSVVELHRAETADDCPDITLTIEPDLPSLEADPERIRQVVGNLIRNACVHNPDATVVRVRLGRLDNGLELTIEDDGDGLGFDPPELAFDTFYRPDHSIRPDRPGSGVGLPLTKRLIDLHRGRLNLESRPGRGTRVSVWLPLDRADRARVDEPDPA